MRGPLSPFVRMQIKITRIEKSNEKLREEVKELTRELGKSRRYIAKLEEKLQDKELQRKELLSYMYKPEKISSQAKPRGKRPGAAGFHRPIPKESDITETHTYTIAKCPICKGVVGKAIEAETAVKFEEEITLVPRSVVRKHVITRHWCPKCETFVRSADLREKISGSEPREQARERIASYIALCTARAGSWVIKYFSI